MAKLKPEDLDKIARKTKKVISLRESDFKAKMIVHMGTCGIAAGARAVMSTLSKEVDKRNLADIRLTTSSCAGLCSREPMMTVELQGKPPVKYVDLNPEKACQVLEKHVLGGEIVKEYALAMGNERVL